MPMSAQQAASSSVTGWVSDPSGAAIANAAVTLTDAAKGLSRTTSTDARGNFAIVDLAQGKYELGVVAKGFSA